jgi:DNA-binding response OmpR family regulator
VPDTPNTVTRGPVLVVEDEPGLADVLALHLRVAGYDPMVARDGLEALYTLDQVTPRAILLDLQLPQVSGFRVLDILKQRVELARVPVLVLTALSFSEAKGAALAGVTAFITKPFHPAKVVEQVERLLHDSRPTATDSEVIPRPAQG